MNVIVEPDIAYASTGACVTPLTLTIVPFVVALVNADELTFKVYAVLPSVVIASIFVKLPDTSANDNAALPSVFKN